MISKICFDFTYVLTVCSRSKEFCVSRPGELCRNPVNTKYVCENLGVEKYSLYVNATGDGHDLPPYCVYDRAIRTTPVIYWNPNGSTISNDIYVRQICYGRRYYG